MRHMPNVSFLSTFCVGGTGDDSTKALARRAARYLYYIGLSFLLERPLERPMADASPVSE
jgi:hypothetical protein